MSYSCTTSVESTEIELKWVLKNWEMVYYKLKFDAQKSSKSTVDSLDFLTNICKGSDKNDPKIEWRDRWKLQLEFVEDLSKLPGYIPSINTKAQVTADRFYLKLRLVETKITLLNNFRVLIRFCVLDNNLLKENLMTSSLPIMNDFHKAYTTESYFIGSVDKFPDSNKHIVNDTLTLYCNIKFIGAIYGFESSKTLENCTQGYLADFKKLLTSQQNSDVTLVVDQTEFKAHKSILSARSPVFAAMFSHTNLRENQTNRVILKDTNPTAIKKFLEYIYTNKIEEFNEEMYDLWMLADKYGIDSLKQHSENIILQNLTIENALAVLKFIDRYSIGILKQKTLNFIRYRYDKIISTLEFDTMIKSNSHLVSEIYELKKSR